MHLEMRFFASFREAVGQKTIEREFEDGTTVGEVLTALEAEFPELDFFEDGEIRGFVRILKNGRDVEHMSGRDTALEDGDELSCFPPVAGGSEAAAEKTFRGISTRAALEYLVGLGGERTDDDVVEGDGWRATVEAGQKEAVGPTMSLTPIHVRFEGDDDRLEEMVERFSQKAMRAGG